MATPSVVPFLLKGGKNVARPTRTEGSETLPEDTHTSIVTSTPS